VFESTPAKVTEAVEALGREYQEQSRGIRILPVAGGYQMCTAPEHAEMIKKFHSFRFSQRLSSASLEVLAIVAYKQPVTKAEIEAIRGVNIDKMMKNLLKARLIKIAGRKDIPGRPFLYGTTKEFLEFFGLRSLKDLPKTDDEALSGSTEPIEAPKSKADVAREDMTSIEEERNESEAVTG